MFWIKELEVDVFGLLDRFRACRTPAEVGSALSAATAPYGLATYAIGAMPTPSDPNPTNFTVHNWPDQWPRMYFEQGFGAHDPVPRAAMSCTMPITCLELREGKAGFALTGEAIAVLNAAAAIGRGTGLIVPIAGPHAYHGIAIICGDGPEPDARLRAQLHLWAIYAHDRMLTLFVKGQMAKGPKLTIREIEVLRQSRRGQGDEEIAQALGITTRTVRFHFDNARRRLGARTRGEALVLAVNLHLLGA